MSITLSPLVNKVNFVIALRDMRQKNEIQEYPPIPETPHQEQEIVKDLVFKFLKHNFKGCHIRVNAHSISLRLDGQIHRKASKIRKIWNDEYEWRQWFERNHRNIYDVMRRNNQAFSGGYGYVEIRTREDKTYLYVPFKPNRIYNYQNNHVRDMFNWLRSEYQKDVQAANIHDEFVQLMETEVERRETERREKYERALNEYQQGLRDRLFRPISELEDSDDIEKQILARKMRQWARENGKQPYYAGELTYDNIVPVGTSVRILSMEGSKSKGWYALPMFDGFEIPEGFTIQQGWGKVTKHDPTGERSLDGAAPIVIQDYIYTSFDVNYWKHLLPEGYNELLEVTEGFADEVAEEAGVERQRIAEQQERARIEMERQLEEQRIADQLEAERLAALEREAEAERRQRQAEEEARTAEERRQQEEEARAQAERQRQLTEQLRQQVLGRVQARPTEPDIDVDVRETTAEEVREAVAPPVAERQQGRIYRRPVGERHVYIVVHEQGQQTYVRRGNAINRFAELFDAQPQAIYDYNNPAEVAEEI